MYHRKQKQTLPKHCTGRVQEFSLLTRQGSNLDSSDPESDVLPITPRVSG
jgi:hypothetical protein